MILQYAMLFKFACGYQSQNADYNHNENYTSYPVQICNVAQPIQFIAVNSINSSCDRSQVQVPCNYIYQNPYYFVSSPNVQSSAPVNSLPVFLIPVSGVPSYNLEFCSVNIISIPSYNPENNQGLYSAQIPEIPENNSVICSTPSLHAADCSSNEVYSYQSNTSSFCVISPNFDCYNNGQNFEQIDQEHSELVGENIFTHAISDDSINQNVSEDFETDCKKESKIITASELISIINNNNMTKTQKLQRLSNAIKTHDFVTLESGKNFKILLNFFTFDESNSKYNFISFFHKIKDRKRLNIKDSITFLCRIFDEPVSYPDRIFIIRYFFQSRFVKYSKLEQFIEHILKNDKKSIYVKTIDFIAIVSLFEYIKIEKMEQKLMKLLLDYEYSLNKIGFSTYYNRYLIQFIMKMNELERENVICHIFSLGNLEFTNNHLIYFDQKTISNSISTISKGENAEKLLKGIDVEGYNDAYVFTTELLSAFQVQNVPKAIQLLKNFRNYKLLSSSTASQIFYYCNTLGIVEYGAFLIEKLILPFSEKIFLGFDEVQSILNARFQLEFKCAADMSAYIDPNCDFFNFYITKILENKFYRFLINEKFITGLLQERMFKKFNHFHFALNQLLRLILKSKDDSESFIMNFILNIPVRLSYKLLKLLISEIHIYLSRNNSNSLYSKYIISKTEELSSLAYKIHSDFFKTLNIDSTKLTLNNKIRKKDFHEICNFYKNLLEDLVIIFVTEKRKYFSGRSEEIFVQ